MKRVLAGNWKMNHGPQQTRSFFERFHPEVDPERVSLIVFPPAVSLLEARLARGASGVALGVQNIHPERGGAFTGETSAEMAAAAGALYALVGHSERRHLFGETDEETRSKVGAALRAELIPVLCVGETQEERRGGRLEEVLIRQLDAVFGSAPVRDAVQEGVALLLAYEPVWAIGTGDTATPADASEAHWILRHRLGDMLGNESAARIPILYGGSVNPGNARELLMAPEVGGVLVGGASLEPESFTRIAAAAMGLPR